MTPFDLYLSGATLAEAAEAAGVCIPTMRKRLDAAGVPRRPSGTTTAQARARISAARSAQIDEAHLRRLHAQGQSCREMAPTLGTNEETVRRRLRMLGLPRLLAKARPDRNYFWTGGLSVDKHGYLLEKMPEHPQATRSGYVRQHRLVVERELGRLLLRTEVVDHRNGDTSDNRMSNLRVFASNADHLRATLTGRAKIPTEERELRRLAAVLRAHQRVAAIHAASGSGADQ